MAHLALTSQKRSHPLVTEGARKQRKTFNPPTDLRDSSSETCMTQSAFSVIEEIMGKWHHNGESCRSRSARPKNMTRIVLHLPPHGSSQCSLGSVAVRNFFTSLWESSTMFYLSRQLKVRLRGLNSWVEQAQKLCFLGVFVV